MVYLAWLGLAVGLANCVMVMEKSVLKNTGHRVHACIQYLGVAGMCIALHHSAIGFPLHICNFVQFCNHTETIR